MANISNRKIESGENSCENGKVKKRIIKDFDKLDKEFQDQVRMHYPNGFNGSLISFYDRNGKRITAFPFETHDTKYLFKVVLSNPVKKMRKKDIVHANDYSEGSELNPYEHSNYEYFEEGYEGDEY